MQTLYYSFTHTVIHQQDIGPRLPLGKVRKLWTSFRKKSPSKLLVWTSPSPWWAEKAGGPQTPGPPKSPSVGSALRRPQWGSCLHSSVPLWLQLFFPGSASMVNRRHQISFHPSSRLGSTHQTDVFHLSFLQLGKARF